jgi:putative iron-regulated protein
MAYLLWGEKMQRPIDDLNASIALTASQKQSGMSIVDLPSNRRRALLKLHSNLLLDDLEALLYRMTHSASAVSIAYHSLNPEARLALWKQTLQHVLADDLLATQLAPKLSPSADFIEHNQFSGRRASALGHSISGIERLLWHNAEGHNRALIDWIVETEDKASLRQQFQALQQQLSLLDEQWHDLPATTHAELLQQLQQIIEQLRAA